MWLLPRYSLRGEGSLKKPSPAWSQQWASQQWARARPTPGKGRWSVLTSKECAEAAGGSGRHPQGNLESTGALPGHRLTLGTEAVLPEPRQEESCR